jgi:hypothetical protein
LDREKTATDEYYPKDSTSDKSYFSTYVFDIILLLDSSEEIKIPSVKITLMPSGDEFT